MKKSRYSTIRDVRAGAIANALDFLVDAELQSYRDIESQIKDGNALLCFMRREIFVALIDDV